MQNKKVQTRMDRVKTNLTVRIFRVTQTNHDLSSRVYQDQDQGTEVPGVFVTPKILINSMIRRPRTNLTT